MPSSNDSSRLAGWLGRRSPGSGWVALRRHGPGPRRWLAAGLVAAAAAGALQMLAPDPPPGRTALVALRDIAAGAPIGPDDVGLVERSPDQLPDGVLAAPAEAVGAVAAGPVRRGELLTGARLVGPGLLDGRPTGEVAAPVRVADAAAAALVRPGQRVTVVVAAAGARTARTVAADAVVLARPVDSVAGALGSADGGSGALVVLATDAVTAADLAQASAQGPLSLVLRR